MAKGEREHPRARTIDWASAEIHAGNLTVELTGEAARGWKKDFEGVVALLEQSTHRWHRVGLSKRTIAVEDIQQGAEEELRHFLESVVAQVNADLHLESRVRTAEATDGGVSAEDERGAADRRMSAAFRAFAQAPGERG